MRKRTMHKAVIIMLWLEDQGWLNGRRQLFLYGQLFLRLDRVLQ